MHSEAHSSYCVLGINYMYVIEVYLYFYIHRSISEFHYLFDADTLSLLFQAVVRPSGGHAVVLKWSMWNVYGMQPKQVDLLSSLTKQIYISMFQI